MTPTESRMRKAAHALPPSDFGSHRAIQAAAAVTDAMVAEAVAEISAALDKHENANERLGEINDEMLAALKSLVADVGGSWDVFEPALREAISNTNYQVVADKLVAARAVIVRAEGGE